MKTQYIILGIIVIILVGGSFFFLKSQSTTKTNPQPEKTTMTKEENMNGNTMGVGYIIKNGKMMIEENGKFNPMTQDVTLKDGTVVTIAGLVTKKDGSTFTLTEGQSMWTDGTFMKVGEEMMKKDEGMNSSASDLSMRYINYTPDALTKAQQSSGRPVIFFAALSWCPQCQAADKDFKANFSKVPKDVTIIVANYDTEAALKQKYNITHQSTFVQVDKDGNPITQWITGGQGVQDLLDNIK